MKNKNLTNGEIGKKGVEEIATNKVTLGDLIWVKHDGGSWWPAQIIDENRGSIKPGDKSAGKVRVRLYGSNEYLYVDPVKCHSKFELELKQNSGSYSKILEKSLEKDLPHSKSSRSKRQGAKSKDDETPEKERKQKRPKQSSKSAENGETNSPSSETTLFGKSPELSARKLKVMQSLGLIAPSGSPFHKMDTLI